MYNYILNVKALLAAFNQEKALIGAFSLLSDYETSCVVQTVDIFKPSFQALEGGPEERS